MTHDFSSVFDYLSLTVQTFDDAKKGRSKLVSICGYDYEQLTRLNKSGAGIYFVPNPQEELTKRGIDNTKELRYIALDLDVAKSGDGSSVEDIMARKAALRTKLRKMKIPPQVIIDTKNGLQPLFAIEPLPLLDVATRRRVHGEVLKAAEALGKLIGIKSEGDGIQRVVRLPGFNHVKVMNDPYSISCEVYPTLTITWENYKRVLKLDERTSSKGVAIQSEVAVGSRHEMAKSVVASFVATTRRKNADNWQEVARELAKGWWSSLSNQDGFPFSEVEKILEWAVRKEIEGSNEKSFAPSKETKGYKPKSRDAQKEEVRKIFLEGKKMGLSTGYPELDRIIGGLSAGQTYLFYADTNVGKSALLTNILINQATRGARCVYFDLENPIDLTIQRQAMIYTGVTRLAWMRHSRQPEWLDGILETVYELPITNWSLTEMQERFSDIRFADVLTVMREEIKNNDAKVFFIDHLHYFSPSETDHAVLGNVARELNNFAAEHGVCIALVAHINKGTSRVEGDEVKQGRPSIDSVMGSKLITSHTKNTIGIQRNTVAADKMERANTKLYVDKTKFGPSGIARLYFNEDTLQFQSTDLPSERMSSDLSYNELQAT